LDYPSAILLGLIQGAAEWLPVSSQAMVALAGRFLLGLEHKEAVSTAILLHGGTMIAAAIYLRGDLVRIVGSLLGKGADRSVLVFLIISTLISGALGAPLLLLAIEMEMPDALFAMMVGIFLLAMAVLQKERRSGVSRAPDAVDGLVAGAAQGLAALPGISRSGMTLSALLSRGLDLQDAFKLSFLMSIPIVAGAEIALPLLEGSIEIDGPLAAGALCAAISGYLTMDLLIKVASRPDFYKATAGLGLLVLLSALLMV